MKSDEEALALLAGKVRCTDCGWLVTMEDKEGYYCWHDDNDTQKKKIYYYRKCEGYDEAR